MGSFRIAYAPQTVGTRQRRQIEHKSGGDYTIRNEDIKRGAINRQVSGQLRDTFAFNDCSKLAADLGMEVGDTFDFKVYVDNPNRGAHLLQLPSAKNIPGLEYFGDMRGLACTVPKCIHDFNFFYFERNKMAITIRTTQAAAAGK